MERTTADMVKDYLKIYNYVEEVALTYPNPDGRIMFFINKRRLREEVIGHIKEQLSNSDESYNQKLIDAFEDVLKNPTKPEGERDLEWNMVNGLYRQSMDRITDEEKKEVARIIEEKLYKSMSLGRTKGFYRTIVDMLAEKAQEKDRNGEDIHIFDAWQECNTPHLYRLEQGIYVEDNCQSDPKCGFCGDYIFIKDKGKEQTETALANSEQIELADDDEEHVFQREKNKDIMPILRNRGILGRFEELMLDRSGMPFRDRFNATKVRDANGEKILENWEVYKNIKKAKDDLRRYRR